MLWQSRNSLATPFVQVVDEGIFWEALYETPQPMADVVNDYMRLVANQQTREIQARFVDGLGVSQWETFIVPVATEPLEHLTWNQTWPAAGRIPMVDVVDGGTHFSALNPEGWDLGRAAADYGASYACEDKTPHEVQIREVSAAAGNGPFSTFTVPQE